MLTYNQIEKPMYTFSHSGKFEHFPEAAERLANGKKITQEEFIERIGVSAWAWIKHDKLTHNSPQPEFYESILYDKHCCYLSHKGDDLVFVIAH